jgi:hypothetical protein
MKFEWRCIDCLAAVKLKKGRCAVCGGEAVIRRAHWLTAPEILAKPAKRLPGPRNPRFTAPRKFHSRRPCSN